MNKIWITKGGVLWDAREKISQMHYLGRLQCDDQLDDDVVSNASCTMGIDLVDEKQLGHTSQSMLAKEFMVSMRYDSNETLELEQSPDEFQELLWDFEKCGLFTQLLYGTTQRKLQFRMQISPNDNKQALYQTPYQLSSMEDTELQCQSETALHNGWIRLSSSQYGSWVLLAPMTDVNLRLCIVFHTANCIINNNRHQLPHIEELLQSWGGSSYFTNIDLSSNYHQIRICVGDWQKTTFLTEYSLYKWTVLCLGPANHWQKWPYTTRNSSRSHFWDGNP